jgi:hypothetical protein
MCTGLRFTVATVPDLEFFPVDSSDSVRTSSLFTVLLITHTRVDRDPKAWIEDEDEARRVSQTPAVNDLC